MTRRIRTSSKNGHFSVRGSLFAHEGIRLIQNPQMRPGGGVPAPGKKYQTLMAANLHPLSRGSVHITSTDPLVQPAIDPAYASNPLDLAVLVKAVRFVRKLAATAPLSDTITIEYSPGSEVQTDEEIQGCAPSSLASRRLLRRCCLGWTEEWSILS